MEEILYQEEQKLLNELIKSEGNPVKQNVIKRTIERLNDELEALK